MIKNILTTFSLVLMTSTAFAAEPTRLDPGETHNFATWAFHGVGDNEVRLAVGLGTVEVKKFNQQLVVTYRAPQEPVTAIEHIFILAKDRAGEMHARYLATIALGKPKTTEYAVTSVCVGQTAVFPIIAGNANRPFLMSPLNSIYAERPSDLEISLVGSDGHDSAFARFKPLEEGTHTVILVAKNNTLRQAVVQGVDCSSQD